MRLSTAVLAGLLVFASPPSAASPAQSQPEADPEIVPEDDLLGELVVEAKRRGQLVLPKITVIRPPEGEPTLLHDILERDLELSGEFDVVKVDKSMKFDEPFDPEAFAGLGLEAVVTAEIHQQDNGRYDLAVQLFLPDVGDLAAWSKTSSATASERRLAGHRLSDGIVGALTGTDGPFASRLILVRTEGKNRRAYIVDPDGKGLTRVSPDEHLVVTAALDRDARPYWAASKNYGRYQLYREGEAQPIAIEPAGSIYGIAFSPNGTDIALSVANDSEIQVFAGTLSNAALIVRTKVEFALSPTYTTDGRLVYAGSRGKRRSIYVGSKAISPKEVSASNPTVCNHPDGPRLIYAVGLGKNTDLVASKLDGSDMSRLTWGRARNLAPSCSPDGRLVAFFSTRKQDGGPGIYLMRVDGRRPKRIHGAVGDVLMWARIPARGKPVSVVTDPEPDLDQATVVPDSSQSSE